MDIEPDYESFWPVSSHGSFGPIQLKHYPPPPPTQIRVRRDPLQKTTFSNEKVVKSVTKKHYACKVCYKLFDLISSRDIHSYAYSVSGGSDICSHCGLKFSSLQSLRQHIKTMHLNEKIDVYRCNLCHESFNEKISWGKHMELCKEANIVRHA